MNLIDESFNQEKKKDNSKKVAHIILAIIVILVIAIIGILIAIFYIQNTTLKLYLDGQVSNTIKNLIIIEEDGTVYMPIRDIATQLGYKSYNGEYTDKSEDKSKCYVQCDDEVANFSLNSDKIYKLSTTKSSSDSNYEYFVMDKPVKAIDGKLYATAEGIQKAFNVTFSYNTETQRIVMYTMPYLIQYYGQKILNYGYAEISQDFNNKKTILDGKLIVKKDKNKNQYGVINADTGEAILEPKYDDIKYLSTSGDFIVTSNKKVGIISKTGDMKVQLLYDSLQLMDTDAGLYLAKNENKYGVIDINGKTNIYIEYDEIGIDSSKFAKNDIKNNYILVNKLIPVRKDRLWGLFDLNGNKVVDFQYDSFGYIASSSGDAQNLLVIPDYEIIIACKDKKYALINAFGEELVRPMLDDVYMTISSGEKKYNMNFMDKTYDVPGYLDSINARTSHNQNSVNSENMQNVTTNTNSDSNNKIMSIVTNEGTELDEQEQTQENEQQQSQESE